MILDAISPDNNHGARAENKNMSRGLYRLPPRQRMLL